MSKQRLDRHARKPRQPDRPDKEPFVLFADSSALTEPLAHLRRREGQNMAGAAVGSVHGRCDPVYLNAGYFWGEVCANHELASKRERIWLEAMDGSELDPIALPPDLTRQCKVGWEIAAVSQARGRWKLL